MNIYLHNLHTNHIYFCPSVVSWASEPPGRTATDGAAHTLAPGLLGSEPMAVGKWGILDKWMGKYQWNGQLNGEFMMIHQRIWSITWVQPVHDLVYPIIRWIQVSCGWILECFHFWYFEIPKFYCFPTCQVQTHENLIYICFICACWCSFTSDSGTCWKIGVQYITFITWSILRMPILIFVHVDPVLE